MNKLTRIALTGLVGLIASCTEKPDVHFTDKNRQPKQTYHLESQSLSRSDHLYALDLDGDGVIDEALTMHNYDTGMIGIAGAMDHACKSNKNNWEHMVAEGYQDKAFLKSSYTRTMTADERDALTNACKILNSKK